MTRYKAGPTKTLDGREAVIMDIVDGYAYFRIKDKNPDAFPSWFTTSIAIEILHHCLVPNVEPEVLEFKGCEVYVCEQGHVYFAKGFTYEPQLVDRKWTMILKEEI